MKKEQQLAFEYGQAASIAACPYVPGYDMNMRKLISEEQTEFGSRRNQENMMAWYEGYRCQTASTGEGIPTELFTTTLSVLTDSEAETISRWVVFADNCTKCGQFVDFEDEGKQTQPLNLWLETLLAGFFDIHMYSKRMKQRR